MFSLFVILSSSFASGVEDVWVQTRDSTERSTLYALRLGFTEQIDGDWVRVHADSDGIERLSASGLAYRPAQRKSVHEDYVSPSEMVLALHALADDHPSAAQLVRIGWSVEERPVYALRISHTASPIRSVRILGAHHGDETSSAAVALHTAEFLLREPTTEMTAWLDDHEVWIVPHVNPDGIQRLNRYNANNVDLNRNYGFMWSADEFRSGDYAFSEPETQNIRALGAWIPAGLGLSLHSGATNIGWVWNYTAERTEHDQLLEDIAATYAAHCNTDEFWITNGADWYVTNGDTTDWSYGRYGTLDYTLEVSRHKHPDLATTEQIKNEHIEAIERTILWPSWLAGQIIDNVTGLGIPATITLSDGAQFMETGPDGRFSRPVHAGSVEARIESPGYAPKVVRLESNEERVQIGLTQSTLAQTRPLQSSLEPSGEFQLDGPASSVVWSRPGNASIDAVLAGENWWVNTALLQPGPWNLTIDGLPAPRAIFVPEKDIRDVVSQYWSDDETVYIAFEQPQVGVHAWAMVGKHRALVPVKVNVVDANTVAVDRREIPPNHHSLVLWHSGRQILLEDFWPRSDEDSGGPIDPNTDTGTHRSEDTSRPTTNVPAAIVGGELKTSAGCNSARSYPAVAWLVSLLGLMRMRRE